MEAIPYEGANEHEALWATLAGWADRARNPEDWHQRVLKKAQLGPAALKPHERGQIKHIALTSAGTRKLADAKIPAEWLCVFDPSVRYATPQRPTESQEAWDPFNDYGLDDDDLPSPPEIDNPHKQRAPPKGAWDAFFPTSADYLAARPDNISSVGGYRSVTQPTLLPRLGYLAAWISQISGDPIAPWWAAAREGLHPALRDMVRRSLTKASPEEAVSAAWELILASETSRFDDFDMSWFDFAANVKEQGWTSLKIRRWSEILQPRLIVRQPYARRPPASASNPISLSDLISAEVKYPKEHDNLIIPDDLVDIAASETRRSLVFARSLHAAISESEYFSLPPITPDPDVGDDGYSRDYGISRLVFRYVGLLQRLGALSVRALKAEVDAWPTDGPIFDRLRMWASGNNAWFKANEAVRLIRSTSDRIFWGADGQRDLLLSLRARWPDFKLADRDGLVSYLAEGPPPYPTETSEDHRHRRACRALERLDWLQEQGCDLGQIYARVRPNLLKDCPDPEHRNVSHAAESMEGRSGFISTDDDPGPLLGAPASKVLGLAQAMSGRDWRSFTEKQPFSGLVQQKPAKAFRALMCSAKAGQYPEWAWEAFFYGPGRASDSLRLKQTIAARLCSLPAARIREFIRSIARWLEETSEELGDRNPHLFNELWGSVVAAIRDDPSCCQPTLSRSGRFDWVSLALNSPGGQLAQALMKLRSREDGPRGLKPSWLSKVDDILSIGGDVRRSASAIFLFNINWFYYHNPEWTEANFLSLLDGDSEDVEAFWSGVLWSNQVPRGDLFLKLKPMLLLLANESEELGEKDQRLAGFLLSGWAGRQKNRKRFVSNAEMRDALVRSGENFRAQTLWHLQRWSAERPKVWKPRLYKFLREVWPQQNSVKTQRTSSRMFDLAIEAGNAFPRIVPLLVPLMTNVDTDAFMLFKAERSEQNLIDRFPESMLDIVYVALSEDARKWPYGADQVVMHLAKLPKVQMDDRLVELRRRLAAR